MSAIIIIMIITSANMIIMIFFSFMDLASSISSTENIGHEVRSGSILSKDPTDGAHRDVDRYNHEGIVDDDEEDDSDDDLI